MGADGSNERNIMNIKPWQEREFDAIGFVAVSPASNVIHMKSEIDELRAALQERDAEIAIPDDTISNQHTIAQNPGGAIVIMQRMNRKIAVQHKVLEQVKEAIEVASNGLRWFADRYPQDISGRDDEAFTQIDSAITAIQGVLKCEH